MHGYVFSHLERLYVMADYEMGLSEYYANMEDMRNNWGPIVESIIEQARQLFINCGAESDFCVQNTTFDIIMFGGLNRISWTAECGYHASRWHCTDRFIKEWKQIHKDSPGFKIY